jgi:hypothetical protein
VIIELDVAAQVFSAVRLTTHFHIDCGVSSSSLTQYFGYFSGSRWAASRQKMRSGILRGRWQYAAEKILLNHPVKLASKKWLQNFPLIKTQIVNNDQKGFVFIVQMGRHAFRGRRYATAPACLHRCPLSQSV